MWELEQLGIPATLIADNAAASLMARGQIDVVVVGADRIAANGDVANKIGTYAVALAAASPRHSVPRRGPHVDGRPRRPRPATTSSSKARPGRGHPPSSASHRAGGARAYNPAFDVTPGAPRHRDRHRGRCGPTAVSPFARGARPAGRGGRGRWHTRVVSVGGDVIAVRRSARRAARRVVSCALPRLRPPRRAVVRYVSRAAAAPRPARRCRPASSG